jgi:hypothetical protein
MERYQSLGSYTDCASSAFIPKDRIFHSHLSESGKSYFSVLSMVSPIVWFIQTVTNKMYISSSTVWVYFGSAHSDGHLFWKQFIQSTFDGDRLCGLVVRVPGYSSRFSEKWWVWNGVRSAS